MKTYKNLFKDMLEPSYVASCILEASKGKTKRKDVLNAFKNFDKTYDKVVLLAKNPSLIKFNYSSYDIIDGSNKKERHIYKPKFNPEQILHHMLMSKFKNIVMDGLYEQVYGCMPAIIDKNTNKIKKFGIHSAHKKLIKWARKYKKLYVIEADIHHAYESVDIDILKNKIIIVIKDKDFLKLLLKFLENLNGLILGHYISPWLFNFYLKELDHYIVSLKYNIKYLRFMDNIFIFSSNKKELKKVLLLLKRYLNINLMLKLNHSTKMYRFEYKCSNNNIRGRAINALGIVIHHNRVSLRKSILKRARRKAINIFSKNKVTWYNSSSMLSRLSWLKNTDTFKYYNKYILPKINIKFMKSKVSDHSKLLINQINIRRSIINDGLEGSTRLAA